jgi:hypothetical protein
MRLWHSAIAASGAAPPPRRAGRRPAGSSPPIFGAGSGAGAGERCAVADYGGKVRGERGGRCGGRRGERVGPTDRGAGEVPSIEGMERGF